MSDVAIRIEGLGKKYQIGGEQKQYDRFGDQILDTVVSPFRRVGRFLTGDRRSSIEQDQVFWALKDISLEIKHGEIFGVIGHNGAGKSTLLKILSQITEPTTGYADLFGRVGSLLEVGTGFHPELTGRENIYLNGSILGMRKSEINQKFDAIVDFAEIEQFIDTPVKRYSSGMYVRLAFSVAAHLEPEILLIDEVLAVGDVAFQKKSLGKMENVSQQGRTVIFVSHNMNALQRLCPYSVLLNHGQLVTVDKTTTAIEKYLSMVSSESTGPNRQIDLSAKRRNGTGRVQFESVMYSGGNSNLGYHPYASGPLDVTVTLMSAFTGSVGSLAVIVYDRYGTKLVNADSLSLGKPISLHKGRNTVNLRMDKLYLNPGTYMIGLWVADPPGEVYDQVPSAVIFEVVETESENIRIQSDGLIPVEFQILDIN